MWKVSFLRKQNCHNFAGFLKEMVSFFVIFFYRFVKLRWCKLLQPNDHPHLPELPGDEISCAQALNLAHSKEKQKKGSVLRNVPFPGKLHVPSSPVVSRHRKHGL